MLKIKDITCHKIVNSRGDWTIQTRVELSDGSMGVQAIPEGASKGENEAFEIPAEKAVHVVSTIIKDALKGEDATKQSELDAVMIAMDGTPNKKHLGGNSMLSVSLAVASAVAVSQKRELYEYLRFLYEGSKNYSGKAPKFPTPVFNIINGGKHAQNGLSFQEFMVIPSPSLSFSNQMEVGIKVYDTLKKDLEEAGFGVGVGDEGGFAPLDFTVEKALTFIKTSVKKHYHLGKDVFLGMDVAAESFFDGDDYTLKEQEVTLNREGLLRFYKYLIRKFPIIYLEDPYYENDVKGWEIAYDAFHEDLMVVGDDLVVTNAKYLKKAAAEKLINAVIVKPNQVGTLTETLDFIRMARKNKMSLCISHRSGDTAEDTFIADLALAVNAEFIKAGSPVRGERVAKYNRLLEVFYKK